MDRKRFLKATGTVITGAILPISPAIAGSKEMVEDARTSCKIPPYLKTGDTIGITCPAGAITFEEVQPAIAVMESWGYKVRIGETVGKKDFTYGGTDVERQNDLQHMLNDRSVQAIMCARGGYGAVRIVDNIDWKEFNKHPKWLIGFSDITVLHSHIHSNCHIATIHSKMTNSFPDDWSRAEPIQVQTIDSIRQALAGMHMKYDATPSPINRLGEGNGSLVGGNLKTLETLAGSASDLHTDGKILFVEDTGEYLYSIDRMFWNLKRTSKLKKLKGLIVGGFAVKPDDPGEEFGKTIEEIVLEKVKEYAYPVCFNFPVGHQRANFALKCGVVHHLKVSENEVSLRES